MSLTLDGPEVARQFVANQMKVWGKVVKDNNIKAIRTNARSESMSALFRRAFLT